jgi:amino acid adenylation domain-containing protein
MSNVASDRRKGLSVQGRGDALTAHTTMITIESGTASSGIGADGRNFPTGKISAHQQNRSLGERVAFPREKKIHEWIEEQVRRTPDATAAIFENQQITYRELDERANLIAQQLQNFGVGADVPVGICVHRSLEMLVALLGILKSGGCYLPLDPAYPRERLAFMLADAKPPVLLTQTSLRDHFFKSEIANLKLLCVDDENFELRTQNSEFKLSPEPAHNSQFAIRNSPLAYVIYTSGSTGKPKGVMLEHRNVSNLFAAMDRALGFDSSTVARHSPRVWLAVTSISFDISVLELFWTLARGFTVVIRAEEPAPISIPHQILRHGVTHFQCTPSLASGWIQMPDAQPALQQLEKFLVGGEALPATLARKLREELRGDLINMYGPTETTVWSASHKITEVQNSIPIGRPIANTEIYILDEHLELVRDGEPGEIFIGGEGVARGYLGRPELTTEKFIPNPFSAEPGARLYRTGDLGRWLADGNIEFLGRADQQVKLSGHRVELGEIECALREHPDVRDCAVYLWDAAPGDARLAACVVAGRAEQSADELRRFLKTKLPEAMIPAAFIWLEKLPLTPNGKLDRNSLPKPGESRPELETLFIAPQNQIETQLAQIWRELLRIEQVGAHDKFFDLGGSSLLMIQMQTKLRDIGFDVPVIRLFEHPTIASLAEFLTRNNKTDASANALKQRARRQRDAFARTTTAEAA